MDADKTFSFAELLRRAMPAAGMECVRIGRDVEPLAKLDYALEITVKTNAFAGFWGKHTLPGSPEAVIPSPKARHYRTTTKRRAVIARGRLSIAFAEDEATSALAKDVAFRESILEPPEHARIYRYLLNAFNQPAFQPAARYLNYLIVRGSYTEFATIFNVNRLDSDLIRKLRSLADRLRTAEPAVTAAFVFFDPTRSIYYLDQKRPPHGLKLKKLFGHEKIRIDFSGYRYAFYPTGFCQINGAMVPGMMQTVRELLMPQPGYRLIDLYCGYGLFSHYLTECFAQVLGLDADPLSIKAARENAALHAGGGRATFAESRIFSRTLASTLPKPSRTGEAILLDPPRQGVDRGVIEILAARRPSVVVEAFCGIEAIPQQVRTWVRSGYQVARIVPLDMFPGTPNLEVLVSFTPAPGVIGASGSSQ